MRISAVQQGSDVLVWRLLLDSPDPGAQGLVLRLTERTEHGTVVRGSHLPGRTGSCFQLHGPALPSLLLCDLAVAEPTGHTCEALSRSSISVTVSLVFGEIAFSLFYRKGNRSPEMPRDLLQAHRYPPAVDTACTEGSWGLTMLPDHRV